MTNPNDHRICFIGDSFVQGACDPECRGWVGRVAAQARADGFNVSAYNLGIRRDTSADIAARWQGECENRFNVECDRYTVFSFGTNDMTLEHDQLRVGVEQSLANFSAIVGAASARYRTLVVGPVPIGEAEQDQRILALCNAYAASAKALGVAYLPVAATLAGNATWLSEVRANDGSHPGAAGYQLLADLVLAWDDWWFRGV
ncbi:MAG: GDSL-type esterase/lipase family protein [Pseudomonadota bacterium]